MLRFQFSNNFNNSGRHSCFFGSKNNRSLFTLICHGLLRSLAYNITC